MKILLTLALYAVLAGLIATSPRADDIDIYPHGGGAGAADVSCEDAAASRSRTLVAGSVPVNVPDGPGTARDIYYALFQSEPGSFWPGNVKKLKLAPLSGSATAESDTAAGEVVAQAPLTSPPRPALSAQDGQILPDALTFWTDPLGADVLAFDARLQEVSGRDGRSVTRGGAGQRVTGFLANTVGASNGEPEARQLFTLDPQQPGELLPFDTTPATLAKIGSSLDPADQLSEAGKLDLVGWIRGLDSFDSDGDGDRLESRPWLLGAPLHSRPLAISYGSRPGTAYSAGNPDIRIFFGSNDGFVHLLQNTTASGDESGRETWAFIPPELLHTQSRLAHDPNDALPSGLYGMDGEAVALVLDRDRDGNVEVDEGDAVTVVIGQRRGGRALYAFDLSDPDSPRFSWKIDNHTPGFEQLALTFSTPRVARLDLGGSAPSPVLVFAGGYNGGWDGAQRVGKDAGAASDTVGNAIFVVDPTDGRLVWRAVGPGGGAAPASNEQLHFVATLTHSIPSALTVIDADRNGVDDRAYVGDSGGNVWRIDFIERGHGAPGSPAPAAGNWYLTRLATLGGSGDGDRRFFHAPDVVQSRDSAGDYAGVLLVSGNRAAPREVDARNFAYLLKDRRVAGAGDGALPAPVSAIAHEVLADITEGCRSAAAITCSDANLESGWKLELTSPGEKGLSTPLVTKGKVLFTSYVPFAGEAPADNPDTCTSAEGSSRLYAVALRDGSPVLTPAGQLTSANEPENADSLPIRFQAIGPGLPADVVPYDNRVLLPGSGLAGSSLLSVPGRHWWRSYWREEEVDIL